MSNGTHVGKRFTGLGTVFLVLFIDLAGFGILFPLYAEMMKFYLEHDRGLLHALLGGITALFPHADTGQQAALFGGAIGAIYSGVQFITAPLWGRLSDRVGRRPVLLFSIGGSLMAALLWAFSCDFTVLLLSRLIAGGMTGNVAVANAAVADLTTPQTRSRGMATVGMAFGLGFILGPAIGAFAWAYLPHWEATGTVLGVNPFTCAALIAVALSLINLVWAWRFFSETLPPEIRTTVPPATRTLDPAQMFRADLGPGVPAINLAFLTYTLLFSAMEATLVFLVAARLNFDPARNGWLFVVMGLVAATMQGAVFRPFVRRFGPRALGIAGVIAMVPGFALLALVDAHPRESLMWTGVCLLSVGTGLVFPALSALASLAGDPARQGWVMGAFRSAGALGRAGGPLLGAIAYFSFSPAAPYWIGAVCLLVPVVLLARLPAGSGLAGKAE